MPEKCMEDWVLIHNVTFSFQQLHFMYNELAYILSFTAIPVKKQFCYL